MKKALITGITGQDGYYLTKLLLKKGYEVHGIKRRTSLINTQRIDEFFNDKNLLNKKFTLYHGDMTDSSSLIAILNKIKPNEIYNLAAQSHVGISFDLPEYTSNVDGIGTLNILEAIKNVNKKIKFYQASTSELYGNTKIVPQDENTPFEPRSPYAAAKLYAYWITVNYRMAYNIFACNGILFNHESPIRGETFVTRKITRAVAAIKLGLQEKIYIGNLDAKRDWGHAKDYVEGMWLMMQHSTPKDFVLATGESHSVREFIEIAFAEIDEKIVWKGTGDSEVGYSYADKNKILVEVDKRYYRPTEVNYLLGNPAKAEKELGWRAKIKFRSLVTEMVKEDLITVQAEQNTRRFGIED